MKKTLLILATMALMGACSTTTPKMAAVDVPTERTIAQWNSLKEGVYLTRQMRNNDGLIAVLREFDLMRNYSGKNVKGILIEVQPFNGYNNRARLDVSLNNRPIESHDIVVRQGRQHLYTDIDMEVRDEIRELSLRYDPRQVSVQSITVLINEDRPWDRPAPGNGGGFPGQNNDNYSQVFERISRLRGGYSYDLNIPNYVRARTVTLEALNAPVSVYWVAADNQPVTIPGLTDSRRGITIYPGYPVSAMLPGGNTNSIRVQAEGMQRDDVALRVTVTEGDNRPTPGPVPRPPQPRPPEPKPIPVINETCFFVRVDPAGFEIATYEGSAQGPMGTDVMFRACEVARGRCESELAGRPAPGRPSQTCRKKL